MISVRSIIDALSHKAVINLALGQLAAQAINFSALPLLTRLYPPEAFGGYSMTLAISSILVFLATFGLSGFIPTLATKAAALSFSGTLITTNLFVGVAGLVLSVIGWVTGVISGQLALYLGSASVVATTSGWFLALRALCNRYGAHDHASLAQVGRAAGFAIAACSLAFLVPAGLKNATLALAVPLGDVGVIIWLVSTFTARERSSLLAISSRRALREGRVRKALLISGGLSHFLAALMQAGPPLFIGAVYGAVAAGWFGLAQRIVVLPTTVLAGSAGTFLSVSLSKGWHNGESIVTKIRLVVVALTIVSIVGFGILASVSTQLVPLIFGAKWAGAAPAVAIMAILGIPLFVTSAINFLPLLTGKYFYLVAWMGSRLGVMAAVALSSWIFRLSFNNFLFSYATVEAIFFVSFALFFTTSKSLAKPS